MVARIARWEVSHSVGTVDRRTALLGLLAVLLGIGVALGSVAAGGVALDSDLYRVAVSEESPYYDPVASAPALDAVDPASESWDVRIVDRDPTDRAALVQVVESPKGSAALDELRGAIEAYNDRQMRAERNQSAAFPVAVSLDYVTREDVRPGTYADDGQRSGAGSGASSGDDGESAGTATPAAGVGGGEAAGTGGFGGAVPDVGSSLFADSQSGSPADIQPPFPFASLVLAFAFLVPLNFVSQSYGSTVLDERIDRRGQLLLVAPVSPTDIVAGKTLPYLLGALLLTALVALGVGGGLLSVLAVLPIIVLYLAGTFVGGMFARSFKELTFVTVTLSVFLTTYTFVPAIFANVTPIALISPLTLVVRDLQGAGVTLGEYLFSTGPSYFAGGALFLLGIGVYREEDMFTQRSVPLKFLDALLARLHRKRSVATLSALFIPFVFVAELLAVAVLFALPITVSVPLLLLAIAAVEEVAKSIHLYAGFAGERFSPNVRTALALGTLSGLGFFVGEKLVVVVQVVGLPEVTLGAAVTETAGVSSIAGVTASGALLLLLAPLVLHVVTASLSALGATRGRAAYLLSMGVAVVVHAAYNLTVVSTLG
jgi:ABC-type Na+ efflux pump permease subunit